MTQIRLDPATGEIVREAGSSQRVDGLEEVAQHVRVRHRLIRGEVPTNLTLGMRFFGLILGKQVPQEVTESEFVDSAVGTPGVVSVDDISVEIGDDRVGVVTYSGTVELADARRRIPLHDTFTVEE